MDGQRGTRNVPAAAASEARVMRCGRAGGRTVLRAHRTRWLRMHCWLSPAARMADTGHADGGGKRRRKVNGGADSPPAAAAAAAARQTASSGNLHLHRQQRSGIDRPAHSLQRRRRRRRRRRRLRSLPRRPPETDMRRRLVCTLHAVANADGACKECVYTRANAPGHGCLAASHPASQPATRPAARQAGAGTKRSHPAER